MSQELQPDRRRRMEHVTAEDVEMVRVIERERTIRIVCIGLCITIGFVVLVYGVVKALDKPPWLAFLMAILSALVGPSGIILAIIRARRQYVKKTHQRIVELETKIDPTRESSEVDISPLSPSDSDV